MKQKKKINGAQELILMKFHLFPSAQELIINPINVRSLNLNAPYKIDVEGVVYF